MLKGRHQSAAVDPSRYRSWERRKSWERWEELGFLFILGSLVPNIARPGSRFVRGALTVLQEGSLRMEILSLINLNTLKGPEIQFVHHPVLLFCFLPNTRKKKNPRSLFEASVECFCLPHRWQRRRCQVRRLHHICICRIALLVKSIL